MDNDKNTELTQKEKDLLEYFGIKTNVKRVKCSAGEKFVIRFFQFISIIMIIFMILIFIMALERKVVFLMLFSGILMFMGVFGIMKSHGKYKIYYDENEIYLINLTQKISLKFKDIDKISMKEIIYIGSSCMQLKVYKDGKLILKIDDTYDNYEDFLYHINKNKE